MICRTLAIRLLILPIGLTTFPFRSREVRRLMLDLDPYGGTDPMGVFLFFLTRTADVIAPRPRVVFRRLVRQGSFPVCHLLFYLLFYPMSPQF